jgi:hypothetical protein
MSLSGMFQGVSMSLSPDTITEKENAALEDAAHFKELDKFT